MGISVLVMMAGCQAEERGGEHQGDSSAAGGGAEGEPAGLWHVEVSGTVCSI